MSDPLDAGEPSLKRWEEFRAQYSAALLSYWVFRDLMSQAPEAVEELWGRFQSSLCDYPELMQRDAEESGEDWDGHVPYHGRDDRDVTWYHVEDLGAVFDSLFPHDLENASIDRAVAGATIVGVHSALDHYAKQLQINVHKGLVKGVRGHLSGRGAPLPAELVEVLADCDATRHIIVHNGCCVDEAYIRQVSDSPLQLGEFRILAAEIVERFSRAVFEVAKILRETDDRDAAA